MIEEHENPFFEIGYTTPDQAVRLRAERAKKTAKKVVKKTVKKPSRRRGRPPVGEEGRLLNIETEAPLLTSTEAQTQTEGVWARREQGIYDDLYQKWLTAQDQGDHEEAARLRARLDARDVRQKELGRSQVHPTFPGLKTDQES